MRAGKAPQRGQGLIGRAGALLEHPTLEPAFVALALAPPGEADIARDIGQDIDPDAIFRARRDRGSISARGSSGALDRLYDRPTLAGGYSPDAAAPGDARCATSRST